MYKKSTILMFKKKVVLGGSYQRFVQIFLILYFGGKLKLRNLK